VTVKLTADKKEAFSGVMRLFGVILLRTANLGWIKNVKVVGGIISQEKKDLAMKSQRRFSREFKRQIVKSYGAG
jgi:hypothetical protein